MIFTLAQIIWIGVVMAVSFGIGFVVCYKKAIDWITEDSMAIIDEEIAIAMSTIKEIKNHGK